MDSTAKNILPVLGTDPSTSVDLVDGLAASDRKTIAHLLKAGIGANTLRATRSDLSYIEAWVLACDGTSLPWPPGPELVLRFIAHHLWDADQRVIDPDHGMPAHVREALVKGGYLRTDGPHAPATVERRIASWRALCRWRGVEHPFSRDDVKRILRSAVRASTRSKHRKSRRNVDLQLMEDLLDSLDARCSPAPLKIKEHEADRLRSIRDRALLSVMFASGGRRRSEISNLMFGQLIDLDPLPTDNPDWPDGLPSMGIRIGRSKTTDARDDNAVFMTGRSVEALRYWISAADITSGPVFLRIDRWGKMFDYSISAHSVNQVLKSRLAEIGCEAADFSAHGVRAGYITSALKAGIPAPEIMEQTLHRSLDTLMGYFKDEEQRQGKAARLL